MVNGMYHKKCTEVKPSMIVLGDAKFSSNSSLHSSFERYFVRKVAPLGYNFVTVNEYLTSQMCSVTEKHVEFVSMRVKRNDVGVYYHRDVMAAENRVNATISIMETGQRPEYLTKKEPVELIEPGGKWSCVS